MQLNAPCNKLTRHNELVRPLLKSVFSHTDQDIKGTVCNKITKYMHNNTYKNNIFYLIN